MTERTEGTDQRAADEVAVREMAKRHDWYYSYSDDGRVFRSGQASWERLWASVQAYKTLHGAEAAQVLYDSVRPTAAFDRRV
jgi:hypothetical protein